MKEEENRRKPALLKFWVALDDALPRFSLFGLDVSLTFSSSIFLGTFRYIAEFVMVTVFGWPENSFATKTAAASVPAIIHSSLLVPSLFMSFMYHRYRPSESLDAAPIFYQRAATCLLQFCTGYMIYDALLNVVWLNIAMGDGVQGEAITFLGHHFVTTLYMTLCRIHGAGHMSAFICMFMGEASNPFQNSYYIGLAAQELDCCNGPTSQFLFKVADFSFGLSYFLIRAMIAPFFFAHATFSLWYDKNPKVPYITVAFWSFLIWLVEYASIPYMYECWGKILKYTTGAADQEL